MMPTPEQLRTASRAIVAIAEKEPDPKVKRVLATHALEIAQQAELRSRSKPKRGTPAR